MTPGGRAYRRYRRDVSPEHARRLLFAVLAVLVIVGLLWLGFNLWIGEMLA